MEAEVTGTLLDYQGRNCSAALVRDITERKKIEELGRKGISSENYEVLVNLIKNGLEALLQGGTLIISTQTLDEAVHLAISDTGCGIPEEHVQRIFEPFFTTKGSQSSGLGLSSCYGIIKKILSCFIPAWTINLMQKNLKNPE